MIYVRFVALCLIAASAVSSSAVAHAAMQEQKLTLDDAKRVQQLRDFEQRIEDAVSQRDHAFLERATARTFVRTHHDGKVEDRATAMALIRQPPPSPDVIRRTINPDTLRVELHGDIAVTRGDLEVRGPRRAYRVAYVRVFRWAASRWQILSHHSLSLTPLAP